MNAKARRSARKSLRRVLMMGKARRCAGVQVRKARINYG